MREPPHCKRKFRCYHLSTIFLSLTVASLSSSIAENNITSYSTNSNSSILPDNLQDSGFYTDENLLRRSTEVSSRNYRSASWQDPREKRRLHSLPRALIPGQLNTFRSVASMTGSSMAQASMDPYENYWGSDGNTQMWQGTLGSYDSAQPANGQVNVYSPQASLSTGFGAAGGGGYGPVSAVGGSTSPYAGYLEKQIASYPVMIYTLNDCIPCQRAKQLLALHYPDVRAHFLELSGNEPWQQQLQVDLQYLTGAITFPYIFVCGQYIGGSSDLFEAHENGQLRRMVSQCLKTAIPKL